MTGVSTDKNKKSLGELMIELLKRNTSNYDVAFSVGPEKIIVRAVKFILKAVSPVFEKAFEGQWKNIVLKEDEGIPLEDLDPAMFQLCLELVIRDTWSGEALKEFNLTPDNLLTLLTICKRFKILKGFTVLRELYKELIRTFGDYKDTDEFLEMSRANLEIIISRDDLPIDEKDVIAAAYRWANHQLRLNEMPITRENFRVILGKCLYELRFSTLSLTEFTKIMLSTDILTEDEQLQIYSRIGMEENGKLTGKSQLLFKVKPRRQKLAFKFGLSVLSLTNGFKIVDTPTFVCNGHENSHKIQTDQKILLLGLGFLGPIREASFYDVSVHIQKYYNGSWLSLGGTIQKRVFAHKDKIFQFLLDNPICLEPILNIPFGNKFYQINFLLKGPDTRAVKRVHGKSGVSTLELEGTEFRLYWESGQLAELLLSKI